ncbi:hypothetical protein [Paraburkholderia bryophila]|uniref:Uncharacterized protein n=1 Tax=Paraburkholderia bryophila TaxID=420952 RepID=A0A7Y9WJI6_9BURK|nr:hypothetical protein [Paraburkholderia bryophila]NYH21433.1 hypothetical protein [Paraburkholderia bryophila]
MTEHEAFMAFFKKRWPEFDHPTKSAFEVWQASRAAALEEAADLAEMYDSGTIEGHEIAGLIRVLSQQKEG